MSGTAPVSARVSGVSQGLPPVVPAGRYQIPAHRLGPSADQDSVRESPPAGSASASVSAPGAERGVSDSGLTGSAQSSSAAHEGSALSPPSATLPTLDGDNHTLLQNLGYRDTPPPELSKA